MMLEGMIEAENVSLQFSIGMDDHKFDAPCRSFMYLASYI